MEVRPIDANAMLNELKPVGFEAYHSAVLLSDVSKMMREWVERQPTLIPPNEWVSVEERLPPLRKTVLVCAYWHEHWGVYIGWNSGHGWTVSCGIGQRSDVQVSHWMPLPAPPDRRPPEEEGDQHGDHRL